MLPQAWLTDAWTLPLWSVLSPEVRSAWEGPLRPGSSPCALPSLLASASSRFLPTSWAPQVDILTVKRWESPALLCLEQELGTLKSSSPGYFNG